MRAYYDLFDKPYDTEFDNYDVDEMATIIVNSPFSFLQFMLGY